MKYAIIYADGSYEADIPFASGWPTLSLDEAKIFDSEEEAKDHAENLIDAAVIEVKNND